MAYGLNGLLGWGPEQRAESKRATDKMAKPLLALSESGIGALPAVVGMVGLLTVLALKNDHSDEDLDALGKRLLDVIHEFHPIPGWDEFRLAEKFEEN
jgi:hypothetical protein